MDLALTGTRALVTAASQGLGRACAASLAAEGARVVISSRDGERLAASADEIVFADTVGVAVPRQIRDDLDHVFPNGATNSNSQGKPLQLSMFGQGGR